jgi:hypothetical protein
MGISSVCEAYDGKLNYLHMFPIQFWTKLVEQKNDLSLRISQAGGILMLACFIMGAVLEKMGRPSDLAAVGGLAGLCLALVGWIFRKFKVVRPLTTDTDIVISTKEIKIGEMSFSVDEVAYLDFLVNSYRGMPGPRVRWRRMIFEGMDNRLYFTAGGKKYSYRFYLEDRLAMHRLELLFREFYKQRLFFRERNRGGRTFLFERVMDKRAFERAKRDAGYE